MNLKTTLARSRFLVAALLVGLVAVVGCNDKVQYTERSDKNAADAPTAGYGGTNTPPAQTSGTSDAHASGGSTTIAGITFTGMLLRNVNAMI